MEEEIEERSVVGKLHVFGGAFEGARRRLAECSPHARSMGPTELDNTFERRLTAAENAGSRSGEAFASAAKSGLFANHWDQSYLHC